MRNLTCFEAARSESNETHLNIAHIVPALTKGGAERVAVDLANCSARDGHSVSLIVGWKVDAELLFERLDPKINVIYISDNS